MFQRTPIYLDHNATTAPHPRVLEVMTRFACERHANPGSQHAAGRLARRLFDEARERIGTMLGARLGVMDEDQLIITSGGTEANNLALRGLAAEKGRLIISAIEHPSVAETAADMRRRGWEVLRLPATPTGVVDWSALSEWLVAETRLVSVMLGNNETGVVQPVARIVEACAPRSIPVHTDAVQVVGKMPVNFRELGVAAMSVAAHKFHGPPGVGALLLRHGQTIQPQLAGGFQQAGLRPGTEPVALTLGMCEALEIWREEALERQRRMSTLRDRFEAALRRECPETVVIGEHSPRLPHTSCLAFPGRDRQRLLIALDQRGVACSTGSACASGSSEPSPALLAMGLPGEIVNSALRFSLGALTTSDEIDEAVRRVAATLKTE
jgi:cysteine desulfurase